MIQSGSVFVWDEREAGMRRWTDGKSWSASRVSGSFLTYREMEGKRGSNTFSSSTPRAGKTPESTRGGSGSDGDENGEEGPDGYRYKADGLIKQSFSITTAAGNHLHLISYYSRSHAGTTILPQPSSDPALRHIRPEKGMYPESTIHEQSMPAVTRTPMTGGPLPPQMGPMGPMGPIGPMGMMGPMGPMGPMQHMPVYGNGMPLQMPYMHPGYGQQWSSPPYGQHQLPPPPHHQGYSQPQYKPALPPMANGTPPPHHRIMPPNGHYPTPFQPSPRAQHLTPQHSQHNSPVSTPTMSMSNLDPRLMNPSPLSYAQQPSSLHPEVHRRTPSPNTRGREGQNPLSGIPSIGALMNGADAYERSRSRSNSKSPGVPPPQKRDGPQDIPHEKLNHGEDVRALRALDRAFKT